MDVSLFVTCLTDLFYPEAAVATVRVLRRLGCRVNFPQGQTCCGQPALNSGHLAEARQVAAHMINVFEKSDVVVSPSGSCTAMVREHFAHLFEGDPRMAARAEALAEKTYEFVEFLEKKLKVDWSRWKLKSSGSVTYHYSCHLRGLGMTDEAVRLLNRIEGIDYRPLRDMDQCCGFGGTFSVKYGDISGQMARDKMECIGETQADTLMCNDGGCALNIAGMCHREKQSTRIRHVAQILDDAMAGAEQNGGSA